MTRWREPVDADRARHAPGDVSDAGLRNHHISNTAYPLAHDVTWRPYRVARERVHDVFADAWHDVAELGLYVHVPFCETRCAFCEYTVVGRGSNDDASVAAYFDALLREFDLVDHSVGLAGRRVRGLDVGGGTPAFAPAGQIARVLERIRRTLRFTDDADISIETTPTLAAQFPDRIAAWKAMGIDRVSMGIQVIQADLLRQLARDAQTADMHRRATDAIRAAGYRRFNVDLMYGFADQTLASWEATLAHAISLEPEYITLYRMRYKLTRISHQAPRVKLDDVRAMGDLSKTMLAAAGYHANPGKTTFSRIRGDVGTSSYLARRVIDGMPYLGFGLGAQSFSPTTISYAEGAAGKALAPYLRAVGDGRLPVQDLYDLCDRHVMAKMCAVSFYFGEIDHRAFAAKFGRALDEVFADEVSWLLARGWMCWTERALSLTTEGARNINGVIPLFYAPSAQRYLLDRDPDAASDMLRARRLALRVAEAGP